MGKCLVWVITNESLVMSHQQKHAILVCGEFPGLSNQNAASCKIWFCTFCDFGRDVDNFLGSQIQGTVRKSNKYHLRIVRRQMRGFWGDFEPWWQLEAKTGAFLFLTYVLFLIYAFVQEMVCLSYDCWLAPALANQNILTICLQYTYTCNRKMFILYK